MMILEHSTVPRCFRYFIAAVAVLLILASPVFSQEPQECLAWDAAVLPMQDIPGNKPSTQSNPQVQDSQNSKEKEDEKKNSGRMFFVMPNYLTVENEAKVPPISWKEKFAITAKGTFDPYEFTIVGVLAGIRQAKNAYPGFGQGFEGYAKRYGAAFADQVDGNIIVGAVFPTILKTDPRYFQLGKGGFLQRFGYAISEFLSPAETLAAACSTFPSLWAMPRQLPSRTCIIPPPTEVFPQA